MGDLCRHASPCRPGHGCRRTPDEAPESAIAAKLRECLALVDAEDRLEVRALQDRIADLEADRRRFGDLIAELGRQLKPLGRQAVTDPDRLAEHQALCQRLGQLGNTYASGREWSHG